MAFDATPRTPRPHGRLPYGIHLACNDPDTGAEIGRCRAIEVCAGALASDDRFLGSPLRLTERHGNIRLAGKEWPILSSHYGVGNWCWNAYAMKAEIVVQFLIWIRRRRLFANWEGEAALTDWMSGGREMSAFEVRAQLDAWLVAS